MSEILLESLRWGGFVFVGGGFAKRGWTNPPNPPWLRALCMIYIVDDHD